MRKSLVRKSLLAIPGIAGLGLLTAASAHAGTIFSADFEPASGYTSGSLPTGAVGGIYPSEPNGVTGKPAGQSPNWDQNPSGENDAYVITDPSNSSNHAAAFVGATSAGTIQPSVVGASLGTLDTTHDITISQAAYFPSNIGNANDRSIIIGNAWAGNFPTIIFGEGSYFRQNDATDPDGTLVWSYGYGDGTFHSAPLSTDAWHTAVITIHPNTSDLASSLVDFSVDGTTVENSIPFDATGLAANTNAYFAYGDAYKSADASGAIYLDNVSITQQVPEPASLGLVALGGMLLIRRRNKNTSPDNSSD